jgi:hypothetical protein
MAAALPLSRLSRGYFWYALRWRYSWAAAHGLVDRGNVIVNYIHDTRVAEGVPRDQIYGVIFDVLGSLLAAGFICNAMIRPVRARRKVSARILQATPRALERAAPMGLAGAVSKPRPS